ncbi:MAG: hypothetical protein A2W31_01230 [Planctomycetes bacterium RBG_16_64_10]|nr:MAG: hypothetical protein A2W31_01230 [Planctomycetes bacterium RBG_16_64_10]
MAAPVGDGVMRAALPSVVLLFGLLLALAGSAARARYQSHAAADEGQAAQQHECDAAQPAVPQTHGSAAAAGKPGVLDPLGPNAACYVCHMTFVDEELAQIHLQNGSTCTDCHGLSAAHANDENIGATPPDIVIERPQINAACRKCHENHDVRPETVVAEWVRRSKAEAKRGAKPAKNPNIVCTDCHGHHRLDQQAL